MQPGEVNPFSARSERVTINFHSVHHSLLNLEETRPGIHFLTRFRVSSLKRRAHGANYTERPRLIECFLEREMFESTRHRRVFIMGSGDRDLGLLLRVCCGLELYLLDSLINRR